MTTHQRKRTIKSTSWLANVYQTATLARDEYGHTMMTPTDLDGHECATALFETAEDARTYLDASQRPHVRQFIRSDGKRVTYIARG